MLYKWSVRLPKLTGAKPRTAYVYVPDACLSDPSIRLPVLYMFDGQNLFTDEDASFGKSWGMLEYLEFNDIPLIVAAVECSHEADNAKCRLSEYAPFDYDDPNAGFIPGRAKLMMDWMTRVFKPMVDRRFPTLPGRKYTFVGGSSMGGLISLYAVSRYNNVYSRCAALSPSLWTSPENCWKLAANAKMRRDTVIYLDYGTEELDNHPEMHGALCAVSGQLLARKVCVNTRLDPGGDHSEASWQRRLPFMFNTLLYGL